MTLSELIAALESADPTLVVPTGFTHPHSYRGYYDELAFEPASNVPIGAMLADARRALGETYIGWKGGEYTMAGDTDCWLAVEGSAAGETLGPLLVSLMLASAVPAGEVPEPAAPKRTVTEILATAATVLRDALADPELTPPPWLSMDRGDRLVHDPGHDLDAPVYVVNEPMSNGANAEWIALLHPGIGGHLAEALDSVREDAEADGHLFQPDATSAALIALAEQILRIT